MEVATVAVVYPGILDRGCISRLSQSYCASLWYSTDIHQSITTAFCTQRTDRL